MFLSDFSIKRPMVVVAVTLAMMIFGYFAMTNLKTNQFPDVQPPVLVMTIPYPGASPETVEREVLNRVGRLDGYHHRDERATLICP